MIILYIFIGIILLLALLFSWHIKFYLILDETTTIHAGLGPIVLQLAPKKEKKPINLSDFTYEKHQKRLLREKKAAMKKAAKKALKDEKKKEKKNLAEEAAKAAENIEKAADEEKLVSVIDILTLVFEELPKLASYFKTEIRMLEITVGGKDADKIARTYGRMSTLLPLLIDLLDNKTTLKRLKDDVIHLNADFLAEKTRVRMNIRLRLRIFSIIRIGWHALVWFIRMKVKSSASRSKNT